MKSTYFVVSDVHSFYEEFQAALNKEGFDLNNPNHKLIVCGDLFDRGSGTKEVYNFVKSLGDRFLYIRGNHEDLLEDCIADIISGRSIGRHHFGNGTVRTVANFCGFETEWEISASRRSEEINQLVYTKTRPLLEFINSKAVDYLELENYIFVHGWVPTINENLSPFSKKPLKLAPREWWDDQEDYSSRDIWREARWTNGMQAWKEGCIIPGKTIVCGHWHTSQAHCYIHNVGSEWGPDACFDIFRDEGIIMLDACTVHSGRVNVLVIEIDE